MGMNKRSGNRTTISLTAKVSDWADDIMAAEGYDSFSATIAQLIRDKQHAIHPAAPQADSATTERTQPPASRRTRASLRR